MVVTVTHDGYIKRLPPSTYRAQGRGGRGIAATNTKEGDFLEHMFVALTHDYILFFTDKGKVYWIKVYDLPLATRTAGGRAIVNLLQLGDGERITGLVPVREFREDECLMMVTRRGTVKKTELVAFRRPLGRGIIALGLDENDELIGVARIKAGDHVVLSTRDGMSIRFDESRVRSMGRPAYGVKGIDLAEGDEVVGMIVANGDDDPASLLTVCANGYGKRTLLTEYRTQNRGGKGLIDIQTSERNGPVVAVSKVTDDDEVMLTTSGGMVIRTTVSTMRTIGRNTQGVRLIKLDEGDTVSSLAKLPEDELGDDAMLTPDEPVGEAPGPDSSLGEHDDPAVLREPHIMDRRRGRPTPAIISTTTARSTHRHDETVNRGLTAHDRHDWICRVTCLIGLIIWRWHQRKDKDMSMESKVSIKRILVTGCCGFIGANFVRYLLETDPAIEITNLDALTYAGNPDNLAGIDRGQAVSLSCRATSPTGRW